MQSVHLRALIEETKLSPRKQSGAMATVSGKLSAGEQSGAMGTENEVPDQKPVKRFVG